MKKILHLSQHDIEEEYQTEIVIKVEVAGKNLIPFLYLSRIWREKMRYVFLHTHCVGKKKLANSLLNISLETNSGKKAFVIQKSNGKH
jgi:hypothetical protein